MGESKRALERHIASSVTAKLEGMNGQVDVDFVAYGADSAVDYQKLGAMVHRLFRKTARPTATAHHYPGNTTGGAFCSSFAAVSTTFQKIRKDYAFICTDGDGYEHGRLYPSHVLPQVYLSNYGVASDPHTIQTMRITHVVNCSPELPFACTSGPYATQNMRVDVTDIAEDALRMSSFFEPAAAFIRAAVEENPSNRVLVHCKHGQSRSATIVLSYILTCCPPCFETGKPEKLHTVLGATRYLQHHRPRVCPNPAFVAQLETFMEDFHNRAREPA